MVTLRALHLTPLALALLWSACVLDRSGVDPGSSGGQGPATSNANSGTSAGGGPNSASSSSGAASSETNCLNGVDDDQDGAIDCADSDCAAAVSCVTGLPGVALGYYLLPDSGVCPAGLTERTSYSCGACQCGGESGTCTVEVLAYNSLTCAGTPTAYGADACIGTTVGLEATATAPGNLGCNPTPEPNVALTLCALPDVAAACDSGVCVPADASRVCALVDVAASCGGTQDGGLVYANAQACGCGCTKVGESCAAVSIDMHFLTNNCTDVAVTPETLDANCGSLATAFNSIKVHQSTAAAQCNPVADPAEAPQGRLCCISVP